MKKNILTKIHNNLTSNKKKNFSSLIAFQNLNLVVQIVGLLHLAAGLSINTRVWDLGVWEFGEIAIILIAGIVNIHNIAGSIDESGDWSNGHLWSC